MSGYPRLAELAAALAAAELDDGNYLIWFGVGPLTIERVQAGELEPSDELERRIDRFLALRASPSPQPVARQVTVVRRKAAPLSFDDEAELSGDRGGVAPQHEPPQHGRSLPVGGGQGDGGGGDASAAVAGSAR
jgi:hypothetical protein